MQVDLGNAKLRSGELMAMTCVLGPDAEFARRVPEFLGHKNDHCQWHITASMERALGDLETRYYLGRRGDEIICNIMTVECCGIGILGHVFTQPEHRRKSACSRLMEVQMQDFRDRSGRCLILGTGYDTHPYHIYRGFGFESIRDGSGDMRFVSTDEAGFAADCFAAAPARVEDLDWDHWPLVACLGSYELPEHLRTIVPPVYGPHNFEGDFYPLKLACEAGDAQCRVLRTANGAVTAFASLQTDPRFGHRAHVLDLYGRTGDVEGYGALLAGFEWPTAKVQAYADSRSDVKIAALMASGFEEEARLVGQIAGPADELDVVVLRRA